MLYLILGSVTKLGDTPLGLAVYEGKLDVVKYLVNTLNVNVHCESEK